jgi:hypothetical protein
MTASKPTILELAKQGDARAIAALMNRYLQPKGITATAALDDSCLQVWLESLHIPNSPTLVEFVRNGLMNLGVEAIKTVKVYGVQTGEPSPVWKEEIDLHSSDAGSELEWTSVPPSNVEPTEELSGSQTDSSIDAGSTPEVTIAQPKTDSEQPSPASTGTQDVTAMRSINWKFIIILILLGLASFLAVVTVWKIWFAPQQERPNPEPQSTAESSPPTTATSSPAVSPATATLDSNSILEEARKLGLAAAVNTQTAQSKAEWDKVVADWQEAIKLLGQIPSGDANYTTAQQKLAEYQRNLDYAQQKAGETQ